MICLSPSGPHGDIHKKQLVTLSDQVPQVWVIHTLLQVTLPRPLSPSLDGKAADFYVLSFEKELITDVHMGIVLCLARCTFSSCEELIDSACIKSTGLLTSLVIPGSRIS